jgi:hypothetical protein
LLLMLMLTPQQQQQQRDRVTQMALSCLQQAQAPPDLHCQMLLGLLLPWRRGLLLLQAVSTAQLPLQQILILAVQSSLGCSAWRAAQVLMPLLLCLSVCCQGW